MLFCPSFGLWTMVSLILLVVENSIHREGSRLRKWFRGKGGGGGSNVLTSEYVLNPKKLRLKYLMP